MKSRHRKCSLELSTHSEELFSVFLQACTDVF